MPDQLQLRGGTTTEHNTFTGASKEVTVDTTKKTAVVHDGATAGGNPLMREDGANSSLALGSAASPSLKFTGDTNTGIYSPGADQVAISTGGTGRLFVSNGTVGIGTTSPVHQLEVNGSIASSPGSGGYLRLFEADNTRRNYITLGADADGSYIDTAYSTGGSFDLRFKTAVGERMRIDSSGRLLVGTSSSQTIGALNNNLQVAGNTTFGSSASYLSYANSTSSPRISLGHSRGGTVGTHTAVANGDGLGRLDFYGSDGTGFINAALIEAKVDGTPGTNDMPGRLEFWTTADGASSLSRRMIIDNQGRLLVGTATTGGMNGGTIVAGDQSATGGAVALAVKYTGTDAINTFGSAYSSANTFIGYGVRSDTTTFNKFLSTADNASWKRGALQVGGELIYSNALPQATAVGSEVTLTERLRITQTGNVGIGTGSPTERLQVTDGTYSNFYVAPGYNSGLGTLIGTGGGEYLSFATGGLANGRLRITSAGNVGIGTASPGAKLHVVTSGAGAIRHADGTRAVELGSDGSTSYIGSITAGQDFALHAGGGEKARIDSSGRLLVGTSSASSNGSYSQYGLIQIEGNSSSGVGGAVLTLARGTAATSITDGQDLGVIAFADNANQEFAYITGEADGTAGSGDYPGRLVFSTTADGASSPTERMRIKSDGIVNVGNTPVYADNTAAKTGGLVDGDIYRKSDGTLMIVYT